MSCNNRDEPDMFGHFREAQYAALKHHWWWKASFVFGSLDYLKEYKGWVYFLEEVLSVHHRAISDWPRQVLYYYYYYYYYYLGPSVRHHPCFLFPPHLFSPFSPLGGILLIQWVGG